MKLEGYHQVLGFETNNQNLTHPTGDITEGVSLPGARRGHSPQSRAGVHSPSWGSAPRLPPRTSRSWVRRPARPPGSSPPACPRWRCSWTPPRSQPGPYPAAVPPEQLRHGEASSQPAAPAAAPPPPGPEQRAHKLAGAGEQDAAESRPDCGPLLCPKPGLLEAVRSENRTRCLSLIHSPRTRPGPGQMGPSSQDTDSSTRSSTWSEKGFDGLRTEAKPGRLPGKSDNEIEGTGKIGRAIQAGEVARVKV